MASVIRISLLDIMGSASSKVAPMADSETHDQVSKLKAEIATLQNLLANTKKDSHTCSSCPKLEAENASLKTENGVLKETIKKLQAQLLQTPSHIANPIPEKTVLEPSPDNEEAESLLLKIREERADGASIGSIIINSTFRPLSSLPAVIQGIESGMNANKAAKSAKMRLIKLDRFLTWSSLIVYELVDPSDIIEIPYPDVGDNIWATTTVLSWRWNESKPWTHADFLARPGFTPMSQEQFTELQTMLRAVPSSISYIWVDWSCGESCLIS